MPPGVCAVVQVYPVTLDNFNYASAIVVAVVVIALTW
jgi:hypothetical protein